MKAAVLREVGKPLVIEDVQISKPGPHEVLIRTGGRRRLPLRPALHRGLLSRTDAGRARP